MRPFRGRFRIRGVFNRNQTAGDRNQDRSSRNTTSDGGGGSAAADPTRNRSAPQFYPAAEDERFDLPLTQDNRFDAFVERRDRGDRAPPASSSSNNPHFADKEYNEDRTDYGSSGGRRLSPRQQRSYNSRSRSPSPYGRPSYRSEGRQQQQENRSRSRSRYRSKSRSRSRSRARHVYRSGSRSPARRSQSRNRRRSVSPSPPPSRSNKASSSGSRSRRPPSRSRRSSRSFSPPDSYRKDCSQPHKKDVTAGRSNVPEQQKRESGGGNFKSEMQTTVLPLKSPTEEAYSERSHFDDKGCFSPLYSRKSDLPLPKWSLDVHKHSESARTSSDLENRGQKEQFDYSETFRRNRINEASSASRGKESELARSKESDFPRSKEGEYSRNKESEYSRNMESEYSRNMESEYSRISEGEFLRKKESEFSRSKESDFSAELIFRSLRSQSPSPTRHILSKPKPPFSPAWSSSSTKTHDSMSDTKHVKSILKRKTQLEDEEEANFHSTLGGIPGLSGEMSHRSSSRIVIPGLGDIDAIEDEEKFLYGDEEAMSVPNGRNEQRMDTGMRQPSDNMHRGSNFSNAMLLSSAEERHNKDYGPPGQRYSDFQEFGDDSSSRSIVDSPMPRYGRDVAARRDSGDFMISPSRGGGGGGHSPFHSRRGEARFNEDSPRPDEAFKNSRSHAALGKRKASEDSRFEVDAQGADKLLDRSVVTAGNRKLEDVLKSMGFDFDRVKMKKLDEDQDKPCLDLRSPLKDVAKEAELYGIKPEMQTSSFYEASPTLHCSNAYEENKMNVDNWRSESMQQTQEYLSPQPMVQYPSLGAAHQYQSQQTSSSSSGYYGYSSNQAADVFSYPTSHFPSNLSYPPTTTATSSESQLGRSNLRQIPLQAHAPAQINETNYAKSNLRVLTPSVAAVGHSASVSSATPSSGSNAAPESVGNLAKSEKEIRLLMAQRESQYKQLELLELEFSRMTKLQGELMRKKQKQKDGHKDPLLVENTKLQEEIAREIYHSRKSIEDTTELLKSSDYFLRPKPVEEKPVVPPPLPSYQVLEAGLSQQHQQQQQQAVKTESDDCCDIEYDYIDPGHHWCRHCNDFFPDLKKFFEHLQSKKHYQQLEHFEIKAMNETYKPMKTKEPGRKYLTSAIKGMQFLMPCYGFFCKLCSEFLGNNLCAESHVKSKDHNFKYLKYVLENPTYERRWNLDKTSSLATKAHELKKKKIEQEREREEKRKNREREAEQRNRELVKAEAEKAKSVELDETHANLKPESGRGREIKLNMKNAYKEESSGKGKDIKLNTKNANKEEFDNERQEKNDNGFGKFTWRKDVGKKESIVEELEDNDMVVQKAETVDLTNDNSSGKAQKLSSKIAIRLSGRTVIPPSIPWQTVAKKKPTKQAKGAPKVTAFPLRKGKNEPSADKSNVDMFSGAEQSAFNKQQKGSGSSENKGPSNFAPTKDDIANAFDGKFESEDEKQRTQRVARGGSAESVGKKAAVSAAPKRSDNAGSTTKQANSGAKKAVAAASKKQAIDLSDVPLPPGIDYAPAMPEAKVKPVTAPKINLDTKREHKCVPEIMQSQKGICSAFANMKSAFAATGKVPSGKAESKANDVPSQQLSATLFPLSNLANPFVPPPNLADKQPPIAVISAKTASVNQEADNSLAQASSNDASIRTVCEKPDGSSGAANRSASGDSGLKRDEKDVAESPAVETHIAPLDATKNMDVDDVAVSAEKSLVAGEENNNLDESNKDSIDVKNASIGFSEQKIRDHEPKAVNVSAAEPSGTKPSSVENAAVIATETKVGVIDFIGDKAINADSSETVTEVVDKMEIDKVGDNSKFGFDVSKPTKESSAVEDEMASKQDSNAKVTNASLYDDESVLEMPDIKGIVDDKHKSASDVIRVCDEAIVLEHVVSNDSTTKDSVADKKPKVAEEHPLAIASGSSDNFSDSCDPPVLSPQVLVFEDKESLATADDDVSVGFKALHEVAEKISANLETELADKEENDSSAFEAQRNSSSTDETSAQETKEAIDGDVMDKENEASDADSEGSGVSISMQIGSDMIVLDETLFETD